MEAYVHLTGYVGSDVEYRNHPNATFAGFRLACTPRIRKGGEWVDGDTTWLSVTCWRGLADNVRSSIAKGDPVVVVGKLRTSTLKRDDGTVLSRTTLDAYTVGHDLSRGTSAFRKTERPVVDEAEREAEMHSALNTIEGQAGPGVAPAEGQAA